MNKALIAAALSTVALGIGAGCEPNTQQEQSTQPVDSVDSVSQNLCSTRDQVHPLDFVLARIGTTVLQCKGSFQYSDFFVDKEGFLQTTIERCEKDQSLVEDLKNLLQLQHVPESGAKNHFAGHWAAWNLRYSKNPVECPPRWDEAAQIDPPTMENARGSMEGCKPSQDPSEPATCGTVPQKLKMDWRITPPKDCENNMTCAHERARLCSDWFGATFHVGSNLRRGTLRTDPSWWTSNTLYAPGTNPFDPAFGYQHQMATSGLPPGEMWGAINRVGEFCTMYTADLTGIMWYRKLVEVDCGGGWKCATRCQ